MQTRNNRVFVPKIRFSLQNSNQSIVEFFPRFSYDASCFFLIKFQFLFSSMKIMSKFVTLFSITRSFCPALRSIDEIPYHAFLSLQSIGEGVKFEFEKTFGNVI